MSDRKQIQITTEGVSTLKKELAVFVEEKRPKLVDRLANARSQGDLAENSDYINAKDELEFMDGKIAELEHILKTAVVVRKKRKNDIVSVGTIVTLKANGIKHEYHVVGEWEADPKNKKISHESPLGQALVGKAKGEKVKVEAPAGSVSYEILSID